MGRTGIRSDISIDRGTRTPPSTPVVRPEAAGSAGYRWPEVSIVRQANIDWPNNYERGADWNRFLDTLGRLNHGKGRAVSLGSMACSYVTAVEMGKMLQKRYSNAFENRAKTRQLQRRFAENYNDFVRRQERSGLEVLYAKAENRRIIEESEVLAELFPYSGYDSDDDNDLFIEASKPSFIGWGVGTFAVKGLANYSRNALGLDLTSNGQLYNEWQETIDYCRHEGLDVKFIDRNREPHLTVFYTEGLIGSVTLRAEDYPGNITLDPPTALVNINN